MVGAKNWRTRRHGSLDSVTELGIRAICRLKGSMIGASRTRHWTRRQTEVLATHEPPFCVFAGEFYV